MIEGPCFVKTEEPMKKGICLIVAAVMLFMLMPMTALAASPAAPEITGQGPWCYLPLPNTAYLFCEASSPDGGTLVYEWYSSSVNDMSTMMAIGVNTPTLYVDGSEPGVTYYWCGVWNEWPAATFAQPGKSAPVYTDVIAVEFYSEWNLEVISYPDRMEYSVGDVIDLTGMHLRVTDLAGNLVEDVYDGDNLFCVPGLFEYEGWCEVKVWYQDAFVLLDVYVTEGGHTHSFGEWMTVTEATCTEEGIRLRECDCGVTERESIPVEEHSWDNGVITAEATETTDGERLFTCTVCGAEYSVELSAHGDRDSAESDEPSESAAPSGSSEGKTASGSVNFPDEKPSASGKPEGEKGNTQTDGSAKDPRAALRERFAAESGSSSIVKWVMIGGSILLVGGIAAAVIIVLRSRKKK